MVLSRSGPVSESNWAQAHGTHKILFLKYQKLAKGLIPIEERNNAYDKKVYHMDSGIETLKFEKKKNERQRLRILRLASSKEKKLRFFLLSTRKL